VADRRVLSYLVVMLSTLLAAHYFLFVKVSKANLPYVLVIMTFVLAIQRLNNDLIFHAVIAYTLGLFVNFVPGFGTLGLLSMTISLALYFANQKVSIRLVNGKLLSLSIVFMFLSVLGSIVNNPISLFQKGLGAFYLIVCLLIMNMLAGYRLSKKDARFIVNVLSWTMIYSAVMSVNNYLGINASMSPLIRGSYSTFKAFYAFSMLGGGSFDYFLMFSPFFLTMLLNDNPYKLNLNKNMLFLAYLSSIIGTLLIFSKTKTVVLLATNLVVLLLYLSTLRLKRYAYATFMAGAVVLAVLIGNTFMGFDAVIKRFESQPRVFAAVIENPLVARGTSRDDAFYWGMKRNTERIWFLGYGWDHTTLNRNAYFHGLSITHDRADFHSLYYSIFPVFGWFGGLIFIYWILSSIRKSNKVSQRCGVGYLNIVGKAFTALFITLLLSGYSSCLLTEPSFLFLLFILMGIANSVYYSAFS